MEGPEDASGEMDSFVGYSREKEQSEGNEKVTNKYPKHVFLIIGNEFCERFSYYGMRTVLVLYVRNFLGFGDDDSTTLFHAFTMLAYFSPLFGGIISDSYWGKYKTIVILSMVYVAGHGFKTVAAIPYIHDRVAHVFLSVFGLLLIALGTGGIKPCVSSFGGDQFQPHQEVYINQFFSLFYFSINAGALLAKIIMPIFRADVTCYPGEEGPLFEECYALAFGLPGILMVMATVLLVSGNKAYTKKKPTGSVVIRFCKCVVSAVRNKWHSRHSGRKEDHWIDFADATTTMKRDTKYVMAILLIFSPLPIFWALFDQQGSRWTLQALQMDRYWGSYLVKPEQMDTLNPLLIVILVPLFEVTLYPFLRRYKIPFSPIRKMASGLILAGLAFVVTAIVQFEIDKSLTPLPKHHQFGVRIMNAGACEISVQSLNPNFDGITIPPYQLSKTQSDFMDLSRWQSFNISYNTSNSCFLPRSGAATLTSIPGRIVELVLGTEMDKNLEFQSVVETKQPEDGAGEVSFVNLDDLPVAVTVGSYILPLPAHSRSKGMRLPTGRHNYSIHELQPLEPLNSTLMDSDSFLFAGNVNIKLSGMYSVYLASVGEQNSLEALEFEDEHQFEDVAHFRVGVAWMIPQYVILTVGEIFLSITGLEFAYTQAPPGMKTVVTSFWLLTVSLGNVIVVIVTQMKTLERQAHEFLLFACLIFIAAIVFMFIGRRYKLVDPTEFEQDKEEIGSVASESECANAIRS